MTKEKKLILVHLIAIAAILVYCWATFLTTEIEATWKHYFGLALFIIIAVCFFRNIRITTIATGIYLLLATFNLLAFTPAIYTFGFGVGPVTAPDMQGLSLGLLLLYFILNMNALIDIYLDYKESRQMLNKSNN